MSFAIWSILIAAILPILASMPAKFGSAGKGYDNTKPRDPAFYADAFRARAAGAQANSYEAFGFYSVAMLIGLTQGGSVEWLSILAMVFIAIRIVYIACYLGNKASLRSLVWFAGFITNVLIFISPVWGM